MSASGCPPRLTPPAAMITWPLGMVKAPRLPATSGDDRVRRPSATRLLTPVTPNHRLSHHQLTAVSRPSGCGAAGVRSPPPAGGRAMKGGAFLVSITRQSFSDVALAIGPAAAGFESYADPYIPCYEPYLTG
jgi:hypothetical protein